MYPDGTKMREYPDGQTKKYNADGTYEIFSKDKKLLAKQ